MTRVAIYPRVSIVDKGQYTEHQLRERRQFVLNRVTEGWTLAAEFVDSVPVDLFEAWERAPEIFCRSSPESQKSHPPKPKGLA